MQCTLSIVSKAINEYRLILVTFIGASVDDPSLDLIAILLKLPLDVVCIAKSRLAVWRMS
jgi:hypothetical protein